MNTMKGGGKSKKMLFFIVLLFVILQLVTIISLAKDASEDASEDIPTLDSFEQIIAALNVPKPEEETTPTLDKILKIEIDEEVPTDSSDSPPSPPSTDAPTTSSSGSSVPSTTSNTEVDNKQECSFILTNAKPTLVINAPKRVNPGDTIEIGVTYNGEPVSGASVGFLGTIVADENGVAALEIPESLGACKLMFSVKNLGYRSTSGFIEIVEPIKPPYVPPSKERAFELLNIQYALKSSILNRLAF